ncbi:UDP-N-acetylglucosamine transferase subunit ALG14 homolog isoform X1 [Amborella trichopoda]|uniref:UDP-N-acetylglucosamine transferase subunit ALG14 n=1 Tax=Amborella trichopoda TaxID=13333 RepID=W1PTD4_AMBTC|nr:UDP-N-acetylglucosamine transferase subunit ALG14 homolog isoform X1 [Amborella trichopoda]ERN11303.1 hypothetical protein AMTR_s00024p00245300 [Amborella trichopoda]|eukprot:XP_006849722.1 UDP-N-acetylglucosamine transferase subunit ALG14 homolog isoform X1 [Amborella trichopoda]
MKKLNDWIIVLSLSTLLILRILYVLRCTGKPLRRSSQQALKTLIVLGSGGHTAEMLNLVAVLHRDRFYPRCYVAAATDNMSLQKARVLEESYSYETNVGKMVEAAQFMQIYRSREVGQSYFTSIGTTIFAMLHALWMTFIIRPDMVLCNGPGTCIPICVAAFLFKVVGIRWMSIVYVESIARVRKLSLSGLLLYKFHLADQFFVQWPQLQKSYSKAHYVGCLM